MRFQRSGKAWQAILRFSRAHRLLPPPLPPLLTTEGKPHRGSLDHDKGGRRSGGVERKNPLCIRQALNLACSGQVGHGPWEWIPVSSTGQTLI